MTGGYVVCILNQWNQYSDSYLVKELSSNQIINSKLIQYTTVVFYFTSTRLRKSN